MKYLIFTVLMIVGCGKGGGDAAGSAAPGSVPPDSPEICKGLYDVWQSETDAEMHDFTRLSTGAEIDDYTYVASSGTTCGFPGNPSGEFLKAQMVQSLSSDYNYDLHLQYSSAPTSPCDLYVSPGSVGGRFANAIIKTIGCNEIQICIPYGAGTCKIFH